MQITTDVSSLKITMRETTLTLPDRKWFGTIIRKPGKTDWDVVISKADKYISGAGAVILALSVLYFTPVIVSIFLR